MILDVEFTPKISRVCQTNANSVSWEKRYTNNNTSGADERASDVEPVVLGDLNDGASEPLHDPRDDRYHLFGNIAVVVWELRHCRSTWLWKLEMVPIRAIASLLFYSFEEA